MTIVVELVTTHVSEDVLQESLRALTDLVLLEDSALLVAADKHSALIVHVNRLVMRAVPTLVRVTMIVVRM